MRNLEKGRIVGSIAECNPFYPKFLVDSFNPEYVGTVKSREEYNTKIYPKNILTPDSIKELKKHFSNFSLETLVLTYAELVNFGILSILEPQSAGFGTPVVQNNVFLYNRDRLFASSATGSKYVFYPVGNIVFRNLLINCRSILNPGLTPINFDVNCGPIY